MKKKKAGFTLIEMMIVLMLTGFIVSVMSAISMAGNRVFANTDVKSDLQIEGQTIQETLSNVGMQAAGIKAIDDIDFESKDTSEIEKKQKLIDEGKQISIQKIALNVAEKFEIKELDSEGDKKVKIKPQIYTFELKSIDGKEGKELSMTKECDDSSPKKKILSTNVDSFKIKPRNTGVEFEVNLDKKKPFSDEIIFAGGKVYPIKEIVLFRNKDITFDKDEGSDT